MTYYILEIASKFESSRAPVSHQLCPFLCFILSPYKSIFLLPNLRRNKGVLIHIMIEILNIPLLIPASSKPRERVPLSVGVVSDPHLNSSYTWIYWPHFCLKPAGKTESQQFHWACSSELILTHSISECHIVFSWYRANKKIVGACVLCTSVHYVGVGIGHGRKEIKRADLFIEREGDQIALVRFFLATKTE